MTPHFSTRAQIGALIAIALLLFLLAYYFAASQASSPGVLYEDTRSVQNTTSSKVTSLTLQQRSINPTAALSPKEKDWATLVHENLPQTIPSTTSQVLSIPQTTRPTYSPTKTGPYGPLTPTTPQEGPYRVPGLKEVPTEDEQDVLKKYGNSVGSIIQNTVQTMGNQNDILMTFVSDPHTKNAVIILAEKYKALADNLDTVTHPAPFTKSASNLADGYRTVGVGLDTLATASTDTMYDQLLAYNSTVETFAESFVPYASLFGALGITFSPDEPGGIFTPAVLSF